MGESWFGTVNKGDVTSRIWQRYFLNTAWKDTGDFSAEKSPAELKTESNLSKGGPGLWGWLSWGDEDYSDRDHKPRGKLRVTAAHEPHGGQKIIQTKSHFAGENHAFLSSTTQQYVFGGTAVPTLDVFNELFIRVERIDLHMDIVSFTYGDGSAAAKQPSAPTVRIRGIQKL